LVEKTGAGAGAQLVVTELVDAAAELRDADIADIADQRNEPRERRANMLEQGPLAKRASGTIRGVLRGANALAQ
jgi:hypothetical protein